MIFLVYAKRPPSITKEERKNHHIRFSHLNMMGLLIISYRLVVVRVKTISQEDEDN